MIDHDVNTYIEVMPESSFWNCFRAYFYYWFIRINWNLDFFHIYKLQLIIDCFTIKYFIS